MNLLAPIVLLVGLSVALYKTQDVWPLVTYKATANPALQGAVGEFESRAAYLKAVRAATSQSESF